MVLLRSLFEAVNVASSLNTTVVAISGPGEAVKEAVPVQLTPAGDGEGYINRKDGSLWV